MLVAAGCGAGAPTSQSLPVAPARGIVLISIDTLRADHLGAYGYHRDTSPFFDALADEGDPVRERDRPVPVDADLTHVDLHRPLSP